MKVFAVYLARFEGFIHTCLRGTLGSRHGFMAIADMREDYEWSEPTNKWPRRLVSKLLKGTQRARRQYQLNLLHPNRQVVCPQNETCAKSLHLPYSDPCNRFIACESCGNLFSDKAECNGGGRGGRIELWHPLLYHQNPFCLASLGQFHSRRNQWKHSFEEEHKMENDTLRCGGHEAKGSASRMNPKINPGLDPGIHLKKRVLFPL